MECEICYGTKTIIIPAGQCGGEIVDEQEIECECVTYEKTDDIDVYVAQCPICKSVRIDTKKWPFKRWQGSVVIFEKLPKETCSECIKKETYE